MKLAKIPNVSIDKSVKIESRKIRLYKANQLDIMSGCMIEARILFIKEFAKVTIGKNCFIGSDANIICSEYISIGNDVLIAWGTTIMDSDSHAINPNDRAEDVKNWYNGIKIWDKVKNKPIIIEDKVWIGFNCIILKGVTIGEGSVVAAGSVVTKNVPSFSVVAGNPAKVVKSVYQ